MSKIMFKAYAKPVSWKLPDGTPLGDHTWVASDQKDVCWSALGSSSETYYCGPDHWKSGKYEHGGSRTLPESGKAKLKAAQCMGAPVRSSFMGIPSAAGIVYGVHGVCHEISNRTLYYTNATVRGADQYWLTSKLYGVYGTHIPGFVYAIPGLGEVAIVLEAGILVKWGSRVSKCWFKSAEQHEEPAVPEDGFVAAVNALHRDVGPDPVTTRAQSHAQHMQEMDLHLAEALGEDYDRSKLEALSEAFLEADRQAGVPDRFEAHDLDTMAATKGPEFDPVDLVMEMNKGAWSTLDLCAEALGGDAYQAAFGARPGELKSFLHPDGFRM